MATITVSREDLFPNGTSVAAYELTAAGVPSSGAPQGTAVETSVVASGSVTFDALDADTSYILYASTPDRYLRVSTARGSPVPLVNVFDSSWAPRPSAAVVLWIGGDTTADDPSADMEVGDVWFPHS